ncbi:MAG: hypothetical protein HY852_21820 [Bradyrhizobium sp.]|uniref:hypothetical protein n=1 Tax=Bradyrhizobium sp. TaxID=376 RepID=UPI0025BFE4BC|nr:hypothetical protein [Bradyrhizobium sp.]MBI5264443.1 hypothetical protein [Bradyrhizobium sp.]
MPKYRGIEYSVIQGVQPRSWKWEIAVPEDGAKVGQSSSKLDAVRAAERAIERALAPGQKRLISPKGNRPH